MIQAEHDLIEVLPRLRAFVKNKMEWNEDWVDIYDDSIINALEFIRDGKCDENRNIIGIMIWKARMMIYDYYRKPNVLYKKEYLSSVASKKMAKSEVIKYEYREEINAAEDKISKLTWRNKRLVSLLIYQEMDHEEIAETMGISREGVSTMILKIRNKTGLDLDKVRDRK